MIALLLLLAALGHPRTVTVLEVCGNAESYLDQRIRVCGHLATTNVKPYLWEVGLYDMRVGVLLRGKWKAAKGRTCIIGRMMRADGKRPGDPQYFTSTIAESTIHPSYYLQVE